MNKKDKKIEKQICKALTRVCESVKVEVQGFQWLTHLVNYQQFPQSLSIICIFDTNATLEQARQTLKDHVIYSLIKSELERINITLIEADHHISFDTEEDCQMDHNGKWHHRFNQ